MSPPQTYNCGSEVEPGDRNKQGVINQSDQTSKLRPALVGGCGGGQAGWTGRAICHMHIYLNNTMGRGNWREKGRNVIWIISDSVSIPKEKV